MQARIKATGEEIIVEPYGDEFAKILPEGDYEVYTRQELSFPNDEIDWQQVRIQAAIAAMQGMLANPAHQKVQAESGEPFGYFYAMNAIMCADVLIAELQKKGGQE